MIRSDSKIHWGGENMIMGAISIICASGLLPVPIFNLLVSIATFYQQIGLAMIAN